MVLLLKTGFKGRLRHRNDEWGTAAHDIAVFIAQGIIERRINVQREYGRNLAILNPYVHILDFILVKDLYLKFNFKD